MREKERERGVGRGRIERGSLRLQSSRGSLLPTLTPLLPRLNDALAIRLSYLFFENYSGLPFPPRPATDDLPALSRRYLALAIYLCLPSVQATPLTITAATNRCRVVQLEKVHRVCYAVLRASARKREKERESQSESLRYNLQLLFSTSDLIFFFFP